MNKLAKPIRNHGAVSVRPFRSYTNDVARAPESCQALIEAKPLLPNKTSVPASLFKKGASAG
jgi:hypothetical protein